MLTEKLFVKNQVGLHARLASLFVKTAAGFKGVEQNHEIEISAEDEDAQEALAALAALVRSNFGQESGQ